MRKNKIIISMLLTVLTIVFASLSVFAETAKDATIDSGKKGTIYIDYKENTEGTDPVVGATFTAYRVADIKFMGNYKSIIPSIATIDATTDPNSVVAQVQEAYQNRGVENGLSASVTTSAEGKGVLTDLPLGLYLVIETSPAQKHFASVPFFAALPHTIDGNQWEYEVTVEPKSLPAGDLMIEKEVAGDAGEYDREFHFTVNLDGYNEPVEYYRNDGEMGTIKSGETIVLKHGQKAELHMIPVGTKYTITESEANQEGYYTTIDCGEGNIQRTAQSLARFFNTKTTAVNTGDTNTVMICAIVCFLAYIMALLLIDTLKHIRQD